MTFSIVACDLEEPAWGVAVASKFPAVGAVVPWAQASAGAVATQSFANTSYASRGLALMARGRSAEQTLERLLRDDPDRELRQVGIVDQQGRSVSFTGPGCMNWAGSLTGPGYAIQGNVLKGSKVLPAMQAAFLRRRGALPQRLYRALLAGDRAGGDKRGRQSAAILVVKPGAGYGGFNDRWLDYRVDDHEDPLVRLGELLEIHALYFGKSPEKDRVKLKGRNLQRMQALLNRLGYLDSAPSSVFDSATRAALDAFLGNENFEERADTSQGWIDRPVLNYLLKRFGTLDAE
jgi:uncharacterized Ntn-hydrolase superfamily protein